MILSAELASDDLVSDPEGTVKAYCAATGIPFVREALSWQSAHRPEWQPSRRWHETVAASTGLGAVSSESSIVPDALPARYLHPHLPYYEALHARRLAPA